MNEHTVPLRERKQRRTRQAIIEAAMALFGERGFDGVTISEIAERAEVGRTTFFRYFSDKQELLFADDDELLELVTAAVDRAAHGRPPIGDSLENALGVVRDGLLELARAISRDARHIPVRECLIRDNLALQARNLVKERRYVELAAERLVRHGAGVETAVLAAGIAAACYATAQVTTADRPGDLTAAVDTAFTRLARLDADALRARFSSP